jgi:hypothetical protein
VLRSRITNPRYRVSVKMLIDEIIKIEPKIYKF